MTYAITTKLLPATNTKGVRIAVYFGDNQKRMFSYDHGARNPHEQAVAELMKATTETGNGKSKGHALSPSGVPVGSYARGILPDNKGYVFVLIERGDEFKVKELVFSDME